jgi:hypothetical protein
MLRSLAFVLSVVLSLAPTIVCGADSPTQRWIVVSDVHFDPLANARRAERLIDEPVERWRAVFASGGGDPLSEVGRDTNDALFESALEAMHSAVSDPAVVIVAGDFLAHDFRAKFDRVAKVHDDASYDAFVDKTIAFLALEFRAAFPHAHLLPVIGNNDGYCADYGSAPLSPFLAHFAASWSGAADDPASFTAQFSVGGYYTSALPAGNARAVVLNDVFWSSQYSSACAQPHADPGADELAWLAQALKGVDDSPVWIIAHIPPGVDTYASLHGTQPVTFLADRFNVPYITALTSSGAHVVMTVSGHTHMESFRIVGPRAGDQSVPMLLAPAISPVFFGNPSFTVLDVDSSSAQVLDSQVFTLDKGRWQREYDFDSVYGHGPFDAQHLWSAQDAIFDDDRVRRRFEMYYDGGSGRSPITDATWRAYWCSNVALTAVDFAACSSPQIQTDLPAHPSAPPPPTPSPTPTASATP